MSGSKYKFRLILLMMFFFSGSVLAAPFLECPMSHSDMGMAEMDSELPCHGEMNMSHNSMDADMDMTGLAKGTGHANSNHCECDQLCNSCLSINTALLPQLRVKAVKAPKEIIISGISVVPSSTLESPFRPPIVA